ncbi:GNAT family N-acetyltransferase [Allokutzneria sp. A3M-2-11 16]|uniref:GNAT family N-acetyltransferase n=1 Tax=Allokutzneria sp. A3M-2-11 16 TaxID=2962043 RepID=UPI0020B899F4|nr:GNAT family N-acetyltransferase [Allokutzneria sp. A3M-2-11 16]MCP3799291.1 GNAT family N-acetyltransferase [Allokutzneria sp. A3M-2-11 16]
MARPVIGEGLRLRHPRPEDHLRLLAVLDEWWGGLGGEAGAQQRALLLPRLYFQHFTTTSWLVEDAEDRLVGFLIGFLSQTDPDAAYVHFVGIDPGLRRSGLARSLYQCFFDLAREHGRSRVQSITSPANTTSLAFHTALGFLVEQGEKVVDGVWVQPDYDGPGLDRIAFVRRL